MDTSTNNSHPELSYAVVYGSIMSIGFPLNAIAIWIFLRHHSFNSPSVIFMLNLAISDLLLAISLPLKVHYFATGTWHFGHITCTLARGFFKTNIHSSSIFITSISIDRLLAVVYPLRSRHIRTARNAVKAACCAWLFALLVEIPYCVDLDRHLEHQNRTSCFRQLPGEKDNKLKYPREIFMFILVLLLLTVNAISTVLVSLTLRRNVKDLPKVNKKVNVMLLFVMSLIMFTLCFLPKTIASVVKRPNESLECIAAANCCLDPVLYYFSLDAFWKKKEERHELKLRDDV